MKIPTGVGDGARVRVAGKGEPGTLGASAGDLFLRVRQSPHPTFTRRGQDLYIDVAVPVTTAVLGGHVSVPRLGGTPLALKIPAATKSVASAAVSRSTRLSVRLESLRRGL